MSKPLSTPVLSIVISAHSEGIIAHKTLRSVARALELLAVNDIPFEIIITLDSGDTDTIAYLKRQTVIPEAKMYQVEFADLGKSRNFGITKTSGQFVAVLDADDLVSRNWFIDGITFLQARKDPAIVHTEWSINFGTQDIAWHKHDSRSKEEDAIIMTWANRWDSALIAARTIFELFPYASNSKGFGSEDWHFNSQTLAADIPHLVLPHSVLFVRRKDISEMTIQKEDNRTVHYTDLLDIEFIKRTDVSTLRSKHLHFGQPQSGASRAILIRSVKTILKRGYELAYTLPPLQRPLHFLKKHLKRTAISPPRFPQWLLDEWRAIHDIEKQVFPSSSLTKSIPIYQSEIYDVGLVFYEVTTYISKLPDYIITVPHIISGGADLVILNYVRVMRDLHPNWHIAVIATDDTESSWANRLPREVDFIPFGQICARANLPNDLQLQLFARLIIQMKCRRLHIIQSSLAFEFARKYKTLIVNNNYTVYACAFCEDIDQEGRYVGHIHSGLPGAYPILKNILTDNKAIINQLTNEYGYDENKFITHYQPSEVKPVDKLVSRVRTPNSPYRILWASRIAKQKRPDIILEIAKKVDSSRFSIDVYGNLQDGFSARFFDNIKNLHYKGGFNGVESLPLNEYDAFIYTSENDGVPNILLGMAAMGLPIIAPDRGGINEIIIPNKTGILIPQLENIEAYVKALEDLAKNPTTARKLARNAHDLVLKRHSYRALKQEAKKLDMGKL